MSDKFSKVLSVNTTFGVGNSELNYSTILDPLHFVLICGFAQEGIFGYFRETRRCLRSEFGNPRVSTVHLHSPHPPARNVEPLRLKLLKLHHSGGGRPLVLLAHSQGGIVATVCLLRHPELLREGIVDRLITVQTPFAGSLIVDLLIQKVPFLGRYAGLSSLRTDVMKSFILAETTRFSHEAPPEDQALLKSRLLFVRSSRAAAGPVHWLLRSAHRYLNAFGPNDGFLLESSQLLPEFGTDLGVLEADHTDLLYPVWMSGTGPKPKHAFTQALIAEILEKPAPTDA